MRLQMPPIEILVDLCAGMTDENREPLYESGIFWIDNAYNVARQLLRELGLPDIRPLVKRPTASQQPHEPVDDH